MRATLLRTGSAPIPTSLLLGSPRGTSPEQDYGTGISFPVKNHAVSPKSILHFELRDKDRSNSNSNLNPIGISKTFRRARSETDLSRPVNALGLDPIASRSFPARIIEEDDLTNENFDLQRDLEHKHNENADIFEKEGSSVIGRKILNLGVTERDTENVTKEQVLPGELGFSGAGTGRGNKIGGGNNGNENFTGGSADQNNIRVYYQEMLKANPSNPLLLRNYGKFLHEVEKNVTKAEEYYGRAILANPGDGEVLSLYAKLIWETKRDEDRAQVYFDQAIKAAPDDCYVLGSYAHFLWDAEEAEGTEEETVARSTAVVEAF